MAKPVGPWVIHVCPLCQMQIELKLRRPENVMCYGVAGNHKGTKVVAVRVVPDVGGVQNAINETKNLIGRLTAELGQARQASVNVVQVENQLTEANTRLGQLKDLR
jgi:hypothetical protein